MYKWGMYNFVIMIVERYQDTYTKSSYLTSSFSLINLCKRNLCMLWLFEIIVWFITSCSVSDSIHVLSKILETELVMWEYLRKFSENQRKMSLLQNLEIRS